MEKEKEILEHKDTLQDNAMTSEKPKEGHVEKKLEAPLAA